MVVYSQPDESARVARRPPQLRSRAITTVLRSADASDGLNITSWVQTCCYKTTLQNLVRVGGDPACQQYKSSPRISASGRDGQKKANDERVAG